MEADLQKSYGIDYRDRWRRDEHGRPRLTLRRICVLCLRHAPLDGEVAKALNDGKPPWTRDQALVDDLRMTVEAVMTEKKHKPKPHADRPGSPTQKAQRRAMDPQHQRKRAAALRRKRERQRAIDAGEIT